MKTKQKPKYTQRYQLDIPGNGFIGLVAADVMSRSREQDPFTRKWETTLDVEAWTESGRTSFHTTPAGFKRRFPFSTRGDALTAALKIAEVLSQAYLDQHHTTECCIKQITAERDKYAKNHKEH